MHLCDFGADLDSCKGPDAPFEPRCTGPGGAENVALETMVLH